MGTSRYLGAEPLGTKGDIVDMMTESQQENLEALMKIIEGAFKNSKA